ncbi:hypothetical protein Avbf_17652 [Armadillidium vulgare]|nr:hypothetical protein Avbf_17652 [Armadillidium vulgare]
MKILGVSKIFFYKTKCHKNVEKILDFYENEGIVQLTTFYFPPPYDQEGTFIRLWTRIQKFSYRAAQNIYITDCLQRNKDDFDYLAVFDPDEIPILRHHRSLPELLKSLRKLKKNKQYSYFLKWKTFFRDLHSSTSPQNETDRSYIFSHNIRTKLNSKASKFEANGKTIHDTKLAFWAHPHNHILRKSKLVTSTKKRHVFKGKAYMGHFSEHICVKKENCFEGNIEEETALLPIREKVVQKMNKVLSVLEI